MNRRQLLEKLINMEIGSFTELEIILPQLVEEKTAYETLSFLYQQGAESADMDGKRDDIKRIGYICGFGTGMMKQMLHTCIKQPELTELLSVKGNEGWSSIKNAVQGSWRKYWKNT